MKSTYEKAQAIVAAALKRAKDKGWTDPTIQNLKYIRWASEYSEPGYNSESGCIALGNWNGNYKYTIYARDGSMKSRWDPAHPEARLVPDVCDLLEKAGVDIEWEDEWIDCSNCNGLLRSSPNSYGWQKSYVECNGEIYCHECLEKHKHLARSVLEEFEGNCKKAITADCGIKLEDHGYVRAQDRFENGLYDGQAANPQNIGKALENMGITLFIFRIDTVGQFDVRFSLWVHESQMDKFRTLGDSEVDDKVSPAEHCKHALQNIKVSPEMTEEQKNTGGILYTKVNVGDGTSTTRIVSPDEFIKGIKD
jgi:hypothetical protein